MHQPAGRIQQYIVAPSQRLYAPINGLLHRLCALLVNFGEGRNGHYTKQRCERTDERRLDLILHRNRPDAEASL